MNSMLSRVRAVAEQMVTSPEPAHARTAIIDIGSNSVRLVIYDGPRRIPFILFNEKVMAGLGASLARTGAIEPEAMERGLRAIGRFAHLCRSTIYAASPRRRCAMQPTDPTSSPAPRTWG